ncbi:MAG: response regulator transcription factor [Gemmatimonadaceae bacterium]
MALPHLLIVDDSALITGALQILFEESGYRVTVAGTVASAVQCGLLDRADIMLLDVTLPDGDGLAVLEALRAGSAEPRATIAVTGHDDDAVRARCMIAGCADVLIKPVPVSVLLARVRSL